MLHRHGGTLCHRFASLLEDGDPLLHVPHVRFERVQCGDHQCLDDRCRACSRVTEGASARRSSPGGGGTPVASPVTAASFGADTSRRGAWIPAGSTSWRCPPLACIRYAPPSCQTVTVNKCIHCTNVYYQKTKGGTTTMCRDLRREEEEDAAHPPPTSLSLVVLPLRSHTDGLL